MESGSRPPALFLTGGTGFIGRRLLARLDLKACERVRCLVRSGDRDTLGLPDDRRLELVVGDLADADTYTRALAGIDVVVHLAALTGKARRDEFFEINTEGTRRLTEACRRAGVPRFVFVSSIAATFPDRSVYYYAQSKERAEQIVRQSGLNHVILRPTIVLGTGSSISRSLSALAKAPVMPIFGLGTARIQPIFVDDCADAIAAMALSPRLPNQAFDLGGPDVLTFEEFLGRLRRKYRGRTTPVVHLPIKPAIAALSVLERALLPILPFTAGQLSAFVNDCIVRTAPPGGGAPLKRVDEMIELLAAHG